ncbi:MAG: endonuclease MutS2 [Gemmatimonadales bacterium]
MSGTAAAASGVPSRDHDGTPVCLDPAWSAAALDALEFAAVLDVIAGFAAGPLGGEAIRALRPTADTAWIRAELDLVAEALAAQRRGNRVSIPPVPDLRGALGRLRVSGSVLEIADLAALRLTLHALRELDGELLHHAETCPGLGALRPAPVERELLAVLDRSIGADDDLLDSASPGLAAARSAVHQARQRVIAWLEAAMRDLAPGALAGGGAVTLRAGRYVIPVRRDSRHRPDGIVHDESASAGTLFIEPTTAIPLGNTLRLATAAQDREVLAVLRQLTERLRPERDPIAAAHAAAIRLDTIVARAGWADAAGAERPELLESGGALTLRAARHPLLVARGLAVVPFDLSFADSERTLLISGPNTGGKTVLLKTVGLVAMLVQAGCMPPLGAGSRMPVVERIFVDIGDHQSLAADLSTFSAHVAALRQILDAADPTTLVLLDEIGSGTDPAEGGALASAVLEALTARGVLTLATTHLGALKTLAARIPGVVNGALQFDAATLSPTYRFTKGVPGRSYGLAIARRLGVDPAILAAAEAIVPAAERELDRLLAELETRRETLEQRAMELAVRENDVDGREAAAAAAAIGLAGRDADLARAERSAKRDQARQAREYLLGVRKEADGILDAARRATSDADARDARRELEEALRRENRRRDLPEVVPAGAGLVRPGDHVRLDSGATGELLGVRPDGRATVRVGAVRLVVPAASLTAAAAPAPRQQAADWSNRAGPESEPVHELDLRGMRADEAEAAVIAALDRAVLTDQPRLAIIHGTGTGVLRDVVRRLLAADRRVASFELAPREQGGSWVTVAVFG